MLLIFDFDWMESSGKTPVGKCDSYTRMLQMNPP